MEHTRISDLAGRARAGDRQAGVTLLSLIAQHLRHREKQPLPESLRDYLLDSLGRILVGEEADQALGVKRRRGHQPSPLTDARHFSLACEVKGLTDAGLSWERAIEAVADGCGLDTRTVSRAWSMSPFRGAKSG